MNNYLLSYQSEMPEIFTIYRSILPINCNKVFEQSKCK